MNKVERIFNIQFQYIKTSIFKSVFTKNHVVFEDIYNYESDDVNRITLDLVNSYYSYYDFKSNRLLNSGFKSNHGLDVDAIEGVCRLLPILTVLYLKNKDELAKKTIRNILLKGCNNRGTGSFGIIRDYSQLIVELADVALSVALLKHNDDDIFNENEYNKIFSYLFSVSNKEVFNNNWKLFRYFILSVLQKYSQLNVEPNNLQVDLEFITKCYLKDGWFTDGIGGEVDYYSHWQFNFFIFWFDYLKLNENNQFFHKVIKCDGALWKYYYDKNGIPPLWGRSICYKIAASFPLFSFAISNDDIESRSIAATALRNSLNYYSKNGGINRNILFSQGYLSDDINNMDHYSGVNSSLWNFRTMMMYYYFDFQFDKSLLLPSEIENYNINIESLNSELYSDDGVVYLKNNGRIEEKVKIVKKTVLESLFEFIFKIPKRKVKNKKRTMYSLISSKNDMYK